MTGEAIHLTRLTQNVLGSVSKEVNLSIYFLVRFNFHSLIPIKEMKHEKKNLEKNVKEPLVKFALRVRAYFRFPFFVIFFNMYLVAVALFVKELVYGSTANITISATLQ